MEPHLSAVLVATLWPVNWAMAIFARCRGGQGVLHVSYMVHIPHYTVELLRDAGVKADYLSVGRSPYWSKSDYVYEPSPYPLRKVFGEFKLLWRLMARYAIIHSHFMITPSQSGWEIKWLKRAGRKIIVHFRGCEARDRTRNMVLHPELNICQQCDYEPRTCESPVNRMRRNVAPVLADRLLVTTRDLLDFFPDAMYFPFFSPTSTTLPKPNRKKWPDRPILRLVHLSVHPGIEGRERIAEVVNRLREKGRPIEFVPVTGVTHREGLEALADADISIGKMKMGDYANAQIESMSMGVPTVTWVRPEFRDKELEESGFILSHLDHLEETLERIMADPEFLEKKRRIARASIAKLHNNRDLIFRLKQVYKELAGAANWLGDEVG